MGTTESTAENPTPDGAPSVPDLDVTSPPTAQRKTSQELEHVEPAPSRYERATLRWTIIVVVINALTCVFIGLQFYEMRTGSADTHDLAVAAGKQADRMRDLAESMKDQAERTKDLADQATIQAKASKIAAESAKRAANIAQQTLHLSERAYLIMGVPTNDFDHKRIDIPLINSGHIPSGRTRVVVHEATFALRNPSERIIPFNDVVEKHWGERIYQSVPVMPLGNLFSLEVHMPALVPDQLNNGKQAIVIAAKMTYRDGFQDSPEQTAIFCDMSSYSVATKLLAMRPCDDPNVVLKAMKVLDGYPSPRNRQNNLN